MGQESQKVGPCQKVRAQKIVEKDPLIK